ncbi:TKL family protein kinase [Histomonas meleagridis]|uniref:TKL family protein kinase n=1 Tax=Histomonas meleagridis TaxID=135588 RepID=UPI0035595612|nr:TKL family protein kinase [Histomonas meleagridis]KAH0805778.1 TKL family protein kinase [Histomonas meleagridis]
MSGKTPQILKNIYNFITRIKAELNEAVVYQKECEQVYISLNQYLKSIKQSKPAKGTLTTEQESSYESLLSSLTKLNNIVQMLSKDFWGSVALEWSVTKPIDDVSSIMDNIYTILNNLQLDVKPYRPSQQIISEDITSLYRIFKSSKQSSSKLEERLKSITIYMHNNGIPIPSSDESISIDIFHGTVDYIVHHNDFSIQKQIGVGSAGIVYIGTDLRTKETVAIKQLKNVDLSPQELESFKREIAVLSALKHPYLVPFVGATNIAPYWIITKYMPGKSLYHRVKNKTDLTPLDKTKIAYHIAEGMAFLHSKKIIHRDLKTLNILLDENNEPKICDFGISRKITQGNTPMTGLIGTVNYMAPELCKTSKASYTLKVDVFSYGMMLWEMVTCEVPFRAQKYDQFKIIELIRNGVRPNIPKTTPKPLKKLITDCWGNEPENRPSFSQILRRMESERICFYGTNKELVEDFYTNEISGHSNNNNDEQEPQSLTKNETEPEKIIRLISMKKPNMQNVNQCIDTILKSPEMIDSLQQLGFIETATFALGKLNDVSKIVTLLIQTLQTNESKKSFLFSNGVEAITKLLKSKSTRKYGCALIKHLLDTLDNDQTEIILSSLLKIGKYKLSMTVLKKTEFKGYSVIGKYLHEIISYNKKRSQLESRSLLLATYLAKEGIDNALASELTTKFAISMGSTELVLKLLSFDAFKGKMGNDDILQICNVLANKSASIESKTCALLLIDAIPHDVLKVVIGYPKFVNDVFDVNADIDLKGKILYKICTFPQSAAVILSKKEFLQKNIGHPKVLALFIPLGGFYPKETLELNFVIETCLKFLKERKYVEVVLRIIGVLSSYTQFEDRKEIVTELLNLLKESYCTELELTLLLGILYNLSNEQEHENPLFQSIYPHLLRLAESNTPYSGLALQVLSTCHLPPPTSRLSGRVFDVLLKSIENGDMYAKHAAGKIIIKASQNEIYSAIADQKNFEQIINNEIINQKNVSVFTVFCEAALAMEYKLSQESLNSIDSFVLNPQITADNSSKLRPKNQFAAVLNGNWSIEIIDSAKQQKDYYLRISPIGNKQSVANIYESNETEEEIQSFTLQFLEDEHSMILSNEEAETGIKSQAQSLRQHVTATGKFQNYVYNIIIQSATIIIINLFDTETNQNIVVNLIKDIDRTPLPWYKANAQMIIMIVVFIAVQIFSFYNQSKMMKRQAEAAKKAKEQKDAKQNEKPKVEEVKEEEEETENEKEKEHKKEKTD